MTFYGLLWVGRRQRHHRHQVRTCRINEITYFMRVAVFVGPVDRLLHHQRWCISLQRRDHDRLLHGYETGIIMRSPEGGYTERHLPISEERGLHAHRARPRRGLRRPSRDRRERRRRPRHRARAGSAARLSRADVRRQRPEADRARSSRRPTTTPSTSTSSRPAMTTTPPTGHEFDGHQLATPTTSRSARPLTAESSHDRPVDTSRRATSTGRISTVDRRSHLPQRPCRTSASRCRVAAAIGGVLAGDRGRPRRRRRR